MGWKESKVGRKRRKKIDFDLTLLEGKAKRRGHWSNSSLGERVRRIVDTYPMGQKSGRRKKTMGKKREDQGSKKVGHTLMP